MMSLKLRSYLKSRFNLKNWLNARLAKLDLKIINRKRLQELEGSEQLARIWEIAMGTRPEVMQRLYDLEKISKSQLLQDLFVLKELDFKSNGFFVEFGATNGVDLSNTWLLENTFGWSGILAEPCRSWHASLVNNRKCLIDKRCVWKETGVAMDFFESDYAELSSLKDALTQENFRSDRKEMKSYQVETVSLNDLLLDHHAPKTIDYLSLDTEGSELEILQAFDFSHYHVQVITVEHNYTPLREKIKKLLEEKGFSRVLNGVSGCDDWYVHRVLLHE